ncbi:hypothetical protein [Pseudoalteromonas aurantia]|uniref:Uncharacterized protein n=1 Tax=Pseudoalteromonas aurantia TaxID=43654 RepID=A0A5S3V7D7_9GAMM|nr:hypothetical protein [Pseudoalteromonas aurantia]TMO62284.1 hypothetical protein CWC18_10460 [Pseudoalteromonas aurantia]TMO67577.1 hypothetical protein CWC19_13630 [Pseudoalteromonas aurantia]TMO73350.1 hypothetical protein CWC20_13625 [Pseudoalteromonas aurantia]
MSSAIFYQWRAQFGDMTPYLMTLMREFEEKSRRPKKIYIEGKGHDTFLYLKESLTHGQNLSIRALQ